MCLRHHPTLDVMTWTLTLLCALLAPLASGQTFRVGRGIADMTGLTSEGALYGYAKPSQDARGLHLRQYSRAFIFESSGRRVALVVTETTMISQALHHAVMSDLAADPDLGGLYTAENVMLSPQHSHSTPGGYNGYYMYAIPSGGWINETANAYRTAIVTSIRRAHNDLQDGNVMMSVDDLVNGNENRSPYSYENNPQEEKDRYEHGVGKEMTVLKLVDSLGGDLGMVNFYPVHTTSMKSYNHLVSSDNKGYAAQMVERQMNQGILPSEVQFVAGFAQGAEGDASPNTNMSWCDGDPIPSEECRTNDSTCSANRQNPAICNGYGPAFEQFEDTQIIGERQYVKAMELYNSASFLQYSGVDSRFLWVNMSSLTVDINGTQKQLCTTAMGYSFAAGATDGPGIEPFVQAMLEGLEPIDDLIDALVGEMPQSYVDCHAPKPVLLPTSMLSQPYDWQPHVVPIQMIRIGEVVILGVPGEITTMAGRRLTEAVENAFVANGFPPNTLHVVVTAFPNCYASYIVTPDEYQMQRYEGASTIYGPHTLDGYISKFVELATAMAQGVPVPPGTPPPNYWESPDQALNTKQRDWTKDGQTFGDTLIDTRPTYTAGETAFATFVAGNPRHDLMTDSTFLEVQQLNPDDTTWTTIFTDAQWETKFIWLSNCLNAKPVCLAPNVTGCTPANLPDIACRLDNWSNATIEWDIPSSQQPGTYRLLHHGNSLDSEEVVNPYTGTSSVFEVTVNKGDVTRIHSDAYYSATGDGSSTDVEFSDFNDFLAMYFGSMADNVQLK